MSTELSIGVLSGNKAPVTLAEAVYMGDGTNTTVKEAIKNLQENSGHGTGNGLSVEQESKLQTAYEHSQTTHVQASDIPDISNLQPKSDSTLTTTNKTIVGAINEVKNDLDNGIDAVSLNGKTFSEPMTQAEYDAILEKDPNVLYLVYEE